MSSNFSIKFNNQKHNLHPIVFALWMLIIITPCILSLIGLYKYGGILLILLGFCLSGSLTITHNKTRKRKYAIIHHGGTRFIITLGFFFFGLFSYFFS